MLCIMIYYQPLLNCPLVVLLVVVRVVATCNHHASLQRGVVHQSNTADTIDS